MVVVVVWGAGGGRVVQRKDREKMLKINSIFLEFRMKQPKK